LIHCLSLWILWATGPSIPSLVPTNVPTPISIWPSSYNNKCCFS
jgi:hypothetical protein